VYVNVRSVGVGRVGVCILCTYVSEEGGDEEGTGSEAPSLLSYTLRLNVKTEGSKHLTYTGLYG
jgi:hypothetical protein